MFWEIISIIASIITIFAFVTGITSAAQLRTLTSRTHPSRNSRHVEIATKLLFLSPTKVAVLPRFWWLVILAGGFGVFNLVLMFGHTPTPAWFPPVMRSSSLIERGISTTLVLVGLTFASVFFLRGRAGLIDEDYFYMLAGWPLIGFAGGFVGALQDHNNFSSVAAMLAFAIGFTGLVSCVSVAFGIIIELFELLLHIFLKP